MHYIHVRVDVRVPIPLDQTQRQQRRSEYFLSGKDAQSGCCNKHAGVVFLHLG